MEELEAARHLQQDFARHPSHTPLVQNKVNFVSLTLGMVVQDVRGLYMRV